MKRHNLKTAVRALILFAVVGLGLVPNSAQARKPGVSVEDLSAAIDVGEKLHRIITGVNRKAIIHIRNFTNYKLDNPRNYLFSGNIVGLDAATEIPARTANAIAVRKSDGAATGCVGVITYRIVGTRSRLAICYSIPHSYGAYENWFKYSVISDRTPINKALYQDMYYNYGKLTSGRIAKAASGQAVWKSGEFTMKGTMDTSGDCKMFVELHSVGRSTPSPVNGRNVKQVTHSRGSFTLVGGSQWKEVLNGRVGYFREVSRTANAVYLVKNNGVQVMIDLKSRKVYLVSQGRARELYRVTSAR